MAGAAGSRRASGFDKMEGGGSMTSLDEEEDYTNPPAVIPDGPDFTWRAAILGGLLGMLSKLSCVPLRCRARTCRRR